MNDRSQNLQTIRPQLLSAKLSDTMSNGEHFQNQTLRPIIKFQNDLFILVFKTYITNRKNLFYQLNLEKRMDYISHAIQKDLKLRNSLLGMVIGHFTAEEYEQYCQNSSGLNKRMIHMIIKRIQNQIQVFESISFI